MLTDCGFILCLNGAFIYALTELTQCRMLAFQYKYLVVCDVLLIFGCFYTSLCFVKKCAAWHSLHCVRYGNNCLSFNNIEHHAVFMSVSSEMQLS